MSACKVLVEEPDCRVMVVDDREFGTNDCRGWLSQSLFHKLQQKYDAELLAKETERLLAQRMEEGSEGLSLSEEEEAQLLEQAKRRIQGKRIGTDRFYQFRLAFDRTQAKGAFKVMADEVARHLDADIILPRSCVKPKYQGGVLRTIRSLVGDRQAHTFRGPVSSVSAMSLATSNSFELHVAGART